MINQPINPTPPKLNFFERAISIFSPKLAFERAANRFRFESIRRFEAAANGRRTEGWKSADTSADKEIVLSLRTLRNRSRDMVRNNTYADNAIETLTNNAIGTGILPTPNTTNETQRAKILAAWNGWAETEQVDFEGMTHFYAIQELAMRAVYESGEVLIRRMIVSPIDEFGNKRIPFSLQVLEGDYLDHTKSILLLPNGGRIIDGKEYDKDGRAVAYYLFEQHPGDFLVFPKSNRIPASEIIHLFIKKRPGQSRGIPAGASGLLKLRDLDDFEDAQLVKQKISACFTAFIQDSPDADVVAASGTGTSKPLTMLEPGVIENLAPGKSITFANPPSTMGYSEYVKNVAQAVAAGYGVTYEALTRDLSNVNFSSGRMGWLEFSRRIGGHQFNHIVPLMNNRVWRWFLDGAILVGILKETDRCRAEWTPPRREMIDPVKEVKGLNMEVRAGFKSWQQAVRENGFDPIKVLAELKIDAAAFDKIGLMPESDPRFDAARKLPVDPTATDGTQTN